MRESSCIRMRTQEALGVTEMSRKSRVNCIQARTHARMHTGVVETKVCVCDFRSMKRIPLATAFKSPVPFTCSVLISLS